jgi:tetratricopeptide (TPR) repeat protein
MALRTLALDPSNTTVQLALATVQHELGAYRASLRVAKNLVEAQPMLAEAHAIAGRASFELGALDDALAHLTEATRLAPNAVESWLDLTRFRAMAGLAPDTVWQELDMLSERFGAATTASLRMRFSFVFRDRERAAEVAREIASARTGAVWEVSLPELEALAGMRPNTPSIASAIVERTRNRRPPAHRERVYHEILIERLVALDELASAHDWLEHDGVILGPVWLERCPSLEPLRGQSRFHGAHAMHHVSHQKKSAGQRR